MARKKTDQAPKYNGNTAQGDALKSALLAVAYASARHSTQSCSDVTIQNVNFKRSTPSNHSIIELPMGSHPDQINSTRRTLIAGSQSDSRMALKYDEQRLSDEDLLRDEIEEAKRYHNGMASIFRKAAEKLEKSGYYSDLSVISARITKIWPDHARMIRKALDPKYKSEAKVRDPNQPATKIQEFIFRLSELQATHSKMNSDLFAKMKADPEIEELVLAAFCGPCSAKPTPDETRARLDKLDALLEGLAQQEAATDIIKEKEDFRQKLSDFQKIMLTMQTYMTSISDAANNIGMSPKWAKAIRDDPILAALIEKFKHCPACGWNMEEWFNAAKAFNDRGIAAPEPDIRQRNPQFLCNSCKKTETELMKKLMPLARVEAQKELNPATA